MLFRSLQQELDTATQRNTELKRGWNTTIQDGLDVAAHLQKLVAVNFPPDLAHADLLVINRMLSEQVKARAELLRSSLQLDDFRRVMQEPINERDARADK